MSKRLLWLGLLAVLAVLVVWAVLRTTEVPAIPIQQEKPAGSLSAWTPAPRATPMGSFLPGPTPFTARQPALPRKIGGAGKPTPATFAVTAAALPTQGPSGPQTPGAAMAEALKVHRMIVDYHTLMGENPVGTNAEIMHAMMGGNPHEAQLGPPEGQALNGKGELVDPWGNPYFFHQLSRHHMEIHSAGPDRVMGTADDVVIP